MTEKEKAIEDGTIELPTGPAEKKKPHRGRIVVITVAALALLAAGGVAWRAHEDRLMAEARADCAAESERLRVATTAYDALLNGKAASMAKTDVKSVKDAKTLDVLSKAMKASTPKTVSCKADSRPGVQDATKGVTANASWYKAHTKSLNAGERGRNVQTRQDRGRRERAVQGDGRQGGGRQDPGDPAEGGQGP